MDWVFQLLSVVIAFGPVMVGLLLWHFVWNKDSGSSSNPPPPPPGGPERRPVPPTPRFSGDRHPIVRKQETTVFSRKKLHLN
ncbi:MAG: hypothetical protein AB8G77_01240 [Rhodothermales bacterium]